MSLLLDISDTDISKAADMKDFLKKIKENLPMTFLMLRNCAMKPENSVLMFTTLKKAVHLQAIDFTQNALSAPFEHEFTDYLKVIVIFNDSHYMLVWLSN